MTSILPAPTPAAPPVVSEAAPTPVAPPPLRRYHVEIARAILGRIADQAGGSISVEVARQGGKNELSAQVELVTLLTHLRRGGVIVKCAPTAIPQARISIERLRTKATEVGLDGLVQRTGHTITCGRARAHFLSAEPGANVVGHTASLLLEVDEAQDVGPEKFDRDFPPMAASTNAPVVYYGTPWNPRSLLTQARAQHIEAERRDGIRRSFRYDWTAVAAHLPTYAQYVEAERQRLGELHPLFRTQYLLEEVDEADRLFDNATLAQLQGQHPRQHAPIPDVAGPDLGGPIIGGAGPGNRISAHAADRDSTVLTTARIRATPGGFPTIEVAEHQAWQGEATEPLVAALADRLRRVWKVRRLAVDATGTGAPVADLLTARLGKSVVDAVTFTADRKSRLGFALLAAAHSGRLRLYAADGSSEYIEARRQLLWARADYRESTTGASGSMRWDVDPARGQDDYPVSLALAVAAAGTDTRPRIAQGSRTRSEVPNGETA